MLTRRSMLGAIAAGAAIPMTWADTAPVRIGIMDGNLGFASDPEAARHASHLGFDSVQVTLGRPKPGGPKGRLTLADTPLQARWREAAKAGQLTLSSTYLDVLHVDCLKDSSLAPKWIEDGIRITAALGAPILMLVFFGKCGITERGEQDAVVQPLRAACRKARDAGIVLGFENTISAGENARILKEVDSPALKVWYDMGNSTNTGGFDVPREIRFLGKERICEFHVKDKGWLGEGKVDLQGAADAIHQIGYAGTCTLETVAPTGDKLADARKNLEILTAALEKAGVKTSPRRRSVRPGEKI